MAKSGIVIASVLSMIETVNLIEQPIIFIETKSLWPMSLYLPQINRDNIHTNFVVALLTLVPILAIYLYGQTNYDEEVLKLKVRT